MIIINESRLEEVKVSSSITQGKVLNPMLFIIITYINSAISNMLDVVAELVFFQIIK